MVVHLILFCILISVSIHDGFCETYQSSIHHCSESNPQSRVDIEQLMGIWYGIEIINHHTDAKHEIVTEEGCPVLYFSEDRTPTTLRPNQYGNNNYNQQNYGSYGRGYNGPNLNVYGRTDEEDPYYTTTYPSTYNSDYQQYHNNPQQQPDQDYPSTYDKNNPEHDPTRRRYRYHEQVKRLRLMWDERGVQTEYSIRYNITKPGVWFTSGPQNGSSLEPKFNSFAGTMQVLKAVGNHMVLSFCFQMPNQQLYTALLSRVQNFSQHEIHGVHSMLQRYGYPTNSIRRVCTHNSALGSLGTIDINYWYFIVLLVSSYFIQTF